MSHGRGKKDCGAFGKGYEEGWRDYIKKGARGSGVCNKGEVGKGIRFVGVFLILALVFSCAPKPSTLEEYKRKNLYPA
jgi:hypothetical protein